MPQIVVLAALCIVAIIYVVYSRKEGSWFNLLTPQLFLAVPSLYVAQLLRLDFGLDDDYPLRYWFYVYACYCLPLLVFALTLTVIKVPRVLVIRSREHVEIGISPYLFLVLGFLLYLPIAIEYRDDLLNPRAIYEQTRTGYGLNFFLSTTLTTLAFLLFLFKRLSGWKNLLFFIICSVFSLAHGSKGQVVLLTLIWLMHWRYAEGKKLSLGRFLALLLVMCMGVAGLFYFFSSGIELNELGLVIASYSDYTTNGMMVIADNRPPHYGALLFEDNFYSRIPRAIWAGKPKDFGSFLLAEIYFPESFDLDQGVPAFGVGVTFADFKWLTLPILCFFSAISALLVKIYRGALVRYGHPADFIIFAFLCGVPLLSLGIGYLLPEHMIMAGLLSLALAQAARRRRRRRKAQNSSRTLELNPAA